MDFNKRVDIYQTSNVADGYGGNTVSELLITSSWANVKYLSTNKAASLNDLGINDALNTIEVILRKRNDITYNSINQFLKYDGDKYVIQHISKYEQKKVKILATKEATQSVTEITPI
jgi:head-tail adaptor